ncbi:MAG: hypothetical protein EBZ69_08225 [Alphaproteobacteria bacterium]|nr:hypothetical protein [Alphaproteobacteria bacterium]
MQSRIFEYKALVDMSTDMLTSQYMETYKWLEEAQGQHSAPLVQGRRLKIRYMTQIKSRPPTFLLWANMAKSMPDDYLRYLTNHMREFFDLAGIPIRWQLKQGENPYQKKAMKKRKPLDKYREKRKQRANAKPVRGSRGKTR